MTRVRYIADSMTEALSAARRNHGMGVRVVHAGARRGGAFSTLSFEVVVEASSRVTQARRAAREALARAVVAARIAADEATASAAAAAAPGPASAAVIARLGARLRSQSLPDALVEHVLERVRGEVARADLAEIEGVGRAAALGAVAALLPVAPGLEPVRRGVAGRPWVVAVAGPTGVGKTTTLAKLAAEWRVARGMRVGLVAADAFRVGAFEQLRTYARIIDAPVRAADGRSSAIDALAALAECDVVLVDTPGRSHRDGGRIGEIADLLGALRPDETHLVLPGSASSRTLAESATAFAAVRPSRIVLSKLDESEGLGALVGAVRASGVPVSWFTTGQEVPDDIERADARRFAERLLGDGGDGAA
jgi:flagellar biosynthesis protein FlhF